MRRRNKSQRPSNKRHTLLIASALVALLLAGYSAYSYATWRTFVNSKESAERQQTDVAQRVLSAVQNEKRSAQQRRVEVDTIVRSATQPTCTVNAWVAWQTILPFINDKYEQCVHSQPATQKQREKLLSLRDFLNDDQSIADVLKSLQIPETPLSDKEWQTHYDNVIATKKSLEHLQLSSESTLLRTEIVARVSTIEQAWSDVLSAHKNQSKPEFSAATNALRDAYTELHKVGALADQKLAALARDSVRQ